MKLLEQDITCQAATQLRETAGLTQTAFWKPVGVQQSVGCRYEQGLSSIPRAVRILLVTRYVCGLKLDAGTDEGVAEISKLGLIQSKASNAKELTGSARTELTKVMKSLQDAQDALSRT